MALITGQALRVRREIPHEPGEWVDIRPLSWKRLDEAKQTRLAEQAKLIGLMGGYRAARDDGDTPAKAEATEPPDAPASASNGHLDPKDYDTGIVLRGGLLAWSYGQKIGAGEVETLDERTAAWLAGEILALHDRSEETRKND